MPFALVSNRLNSAKHVASLMHIIAVLGDVLARGDFYSPACISMLALVRC